LNDADNCEDDEALILDEWNMSGELVKGYMTGENRSEGTGKVHPIIGHEGPEVERISSWREKKTCPSTMNPKRTGIRDEPESDQG